MKIGKDLVLQKSSLNQTIIINRIFVKKHIIIFKLPNAMNLKNVICLLTIVLVFNCSWNSDNNISQPDPDPNSKVTYEANVKSVIGGNCLQCHSSPTANGAPFSLVTYIQVKDKIDAILSRINSSSSPMPPTGQMILKNRDLIQQWKDDGLLEN